MSRLKNISFQIAAFLMLFSAAGSLQATHIVGGDMTYKCLGNDQYEVTLTIRRDCENGAEDAPFDDPAIIGVFDIFGSLQTHLGDIGRIKIPFMGEDTITNSIVFDCSALGTPVCVHEAVYRDTLFLPFNKIGYRLAYQRCCRNSILVNIEDPLETGATYHVALPITVLTECNSQPVFKSWPDVYLCVNENLSFDHSATDSDGDQLIYKLCTPSQGATSDDPQPFTPSNPPYPTIVWQNPYGVNNMIASNPPLAINSSTGLLTGLPNQVGSYLVGVCVEEYRNGELLSTVRRDFEYNVRVCGDPIDLACTISGNECDGDKLVEFTNESQGADSYRWLFTNTNGDTIFTTSDQMFEFEFPEFGRYTITLEGTRNSDGCTARKIETIVIGNPEVIADFDFTLDSCDSLNLIRLTDASFDPLMSSQPSAWEWMVNGNNAGNTSTITYDAESETELEVTLTVVFNSGCIADTTMVLNVSNLFPEASFDYELLTCTDNGFEIRLESEYMPANLLVVEKIWTITDNGVVSTYTDDPLMIEISGQDTEVSLSIIFDNGCNKVINETISESDLLPILKIAREPIEECPELGDTVELLFYPEILGSVIMSNISEYLWTVNGVTYTTEEIQISLIVGDSLDLSLNITYDNGCLIETSDVQVPDFAPELLLEVQTECLDDGTVKLTITDITGLVVDSYTWYDGTMNYLFDSMFMITLLEDEEKEFFIDVTFANGCMQTGSVVFNSELFRPSIDFDIDVTSCEGDTAMVSIDYQPGLDIENETIIINGVNYDSLGITLTIPLDSVLNIEYSVNYTNGCSDTFSSTDTVRNYLPQIDFDIDLLGCSNDGFEVSLNSELISSDIVVVETLWTINDLGVITTYNDDPLVIIISGMDSEVSLTVFFENGCSQEITKVINDSDFLPQLEIIQESLAECPETGDTVNVTLYPALSGGLSNADITDYLWTINDEIFTTEQVEINVVVGDSLDISLQIIFDNGCTIETTEVIDSNFSPELDINVTTECLEDGRVKLTLTDITDFPVDSYLWYDTNQQFSTTDSMLMDTLNEDEEREFFVEVTYVNGCVQEWSLLFNSGLFRPTIDFDINVASCEGDTATVNINYNSGIDVINEVIIINGVTYDSLGVTLEINLDSILTIEYSVDYANGCSDSYFSSDTVRNYLPVASFASALIDCRPNGIVISINDATIYSGDHTTEWIVIDGDSTYVLSDPIDSIFVSNPSITLIQNINYDNGCSDSDTSVLNQLDLLPELEDPVLDYTITPIECFGDSGIFMFADITEVPECMYIVDYLWVVNGDSCIGNPVTKTLPLGVNISFSYTVSFNTGLILSTSSDTIVENDTINSDGIVDTLGIEIGNNNAGFCNDSISIFVVNPDSTVNYEWSTDNEFDDIIGTGIKLDTVLGSMFEGMIYIQSIDNFGPCVYGIDSIQINLDTINISFDDPFVICPGDTSNFEIINNNPDHDISYEWKGGNGELISGEDTANPIIGIPDDATDDFFYILCASNQFGCSSVDTIRFMVGERDSLQEFMFSIDSCGSLTVMFDETPNMIGDNALWDFGDGDIGFGSTPTHEYEEPGTYTVTLMDTSIVCSSESISIDITLGLLMLEIIPDTIFYDADSLVTVFAETNGNPDSIQWCTIDGITVGTGNPLTDFDAMMDTVLLIAKIVDQFGCMDRDTVVLVPDVDPEECLDSVEIDGPEIAIVCVDEEFQLCVTMSDECELSDFEFLWNPDDCIVSGQGTAKVIVSASESKTIMVLVTHVETGLDSIYSFDIEVSDPDPQISIPVINLDENNNPFVCLGQSIELSVNPEDPNCDYTWSNGATGPVIEITPEVDFTIWVECVDEFGCVGVSDSLTVRVVPPQCDESDVFIPNAFSPNGDNINDVLFVRSKFIESMELVIVNRWGQEVFRSTDQTIGWDGTYNGESLAPDAFSFTLSVICVDGQNYVKIGNVSIIK